MKPGDRVRIHGLTMRPDLNGADGELLKFSEERWGVRLNLFLDDKVESMRLKPSNLIRILMDDELEHLTKRLAPHVRCMMLFLCFAHGDLTLDEAVTLHRRDIEVVEDSQFLPRDTYVLKKRFLLSKKRNPVVCPVKALGEMLLQDMTDAKGVLEAQMDEPIFIDATTGEVEEVLCIALRCVGVEPIPSAEAVFCATMPPSRFAVDKAIKDAQAAGEAWAGV